MTVKKSKEEYSLFTNKIWIKRAIILAFADIVAVLFASVAALWVRYDFSFEAMNREFFMNAVKMIPCNILSSLVIFWFCKLYQSVWRYASSNELIKVGIAVLLEGSFQLIVFLTAKISVPRSYYIFYTFILGFCTVVIRFSYRFLRIVRMSHNAFREGADRRNILVVGAGSAGNSIIKEIESSSHITMHVKCLIDDNPGCQGKLLRGIPIVGGREKIPEAVIKYNIDEIIVAIPSAKRSEIKKIVEICKETECRISMVPGIYQLINGEVSVSQLREVDIEDLLGREPVAINNAEVSDYVSGKTVMVTGGGGSIGSELCRQISEFNPKLLIILDIYENNAYDIQQELKIKKPDLNLKVLIASVRDSKKLEQIFDQYRPDIVYHAAAHKHVPLMEDSPAEAIKNNVFGTYNTAKAADKYGTEKFVLVSTDKAVNPTNIMGASKRMCEMVIQMMNERSKTEYVAVRFGNVLGSNGSVIPLFKKQIMAGGPVTVTDPNIIRYFMTIPEAVSLILQAGAYARGGEIFVLDMGEPVKILELAENLIKLSGFRVGEDIEIVFTGLRPGEKMYEELLMSEEGLKDTDNSLIHIGNPIKFDKELFEKELEELNGICVENPDEVKWAVSRIVKTYSYKE